MLAAVYHGAEDLRLEQRPTPSPGAGELVLRVDFASICATDLRILRGVHRKFGPGTVRVPGHEVVGTIADIGAGVRRGLGVGQRVFIAPNVGCGHCRQCLRGENNLCANYQALGITLDGAFAEFLRIPAPFVEQGNVMPFPDALEGAAVALAEPFACVLRGQQALKVGSGDVVLVLGAGPIGVMHVLAAKAAGAAKILVSDLAPVRLEAAARMGADRVVNAREESLPDVVAARDRRRRSRRHRGRGGGARGDGKRPSARGHQRPHQLLRGPRSRRRGRAAGRQPDPLRELIVTGTTALQHRRLPAFTGAHQFGEGGSRPARQRPIRS